VGKKQKEEVKAEEEGGQRWVSFPLYFLFSLPLVWLGLMGIFP
jgi:hypothetical protein